MNYICYSTSAEFLANIDKTQPVNAECLSENGKPGKYGMGIATSAVVLSQAGTKECHIFFQPVTRYSTMNGEYFGKDSEWENHTRRSRTAFELTCAWLETHGLKYRKAMLAVPKNLRKVKGRASYMQYDKESDSYVEVTP